jgi:hypothetical protein
MTTTALRAGAVLALVVALAVGTASAMATDDASAALSEDVSISPTRTMHLQCEGRGGPTVVLIAGGYNSGAIWSMPYDFRSPGPDRVPRGRHVLTRVRVRPSGTASPGPNDQVVAGSATPVPQPVTEANGVADLHDLLEAADVPGPYVFVAHSGDRDQQRSSHLPVLAAACEHCDS